jgi:two-component system response regulator HydG
MNGQVYPMNRLLIVHLDAATRSMMSSMLQTMGHRIEEAETDRTAVRMLDQAPFQLVLVGFQNELVEVTELLGLLRRKYPRTPVLVFGRSPRPEMVRDAALRGAAGCIPFPVPASQLRAAVAQACPDLPAVRPLPGFGHNGPSMFDRTAAPRHQGWTTAAAISTLDRGAGYPDSSSPCSRLPLNDGLDGSPEPLFLGDDPNIRQVLELVNALGAMRTNVLLLGERGTGKRLLARILHRRTSRVDGNDLYFDCQTANEDDLEAELFGRVLDDRYEPGLIARAAGGTLFLDNVSALDPAQQNLLLRALRDSDYRPAGLSRPMRVDCRFVIGSTEELGPLVERGQFRPDLFYTLSAVTLKLPPLRHRGPDILRLAEHFLQVFARQYKQSILGISPDASRRLSSHDWPENVAELERVMERAVARCRGHWIEVTHIDLGTPPAHAYGSASPAAVTQTILPLKEALEEPEKRLILEALRALNWNRQETARVLDINRTTLYKKMKKYGLIFEEPVWTN